MHKGDLCTGHPPTRALKLLPRLSPELQKHTRSKALGGRQAGWEIPNAGVLDEIV